MAKFFGYVSLLLWAVSPLIIGLLLFTNGFFLHRVARTDRNNCSTQVSEITESTDPASIASECLPPRAKVVLLLVDALKFEFAEKFTDEASDACFYRNKLPIISDTVQRYPENARLFKFIADPPTTTMQRLKSLTTGTLPTFIDLHDNFAADEIQEDNLVDLNSKNGIVFMGDDTWVNLYPEKFLREYAAPSFDVSDLDSVDLKVRKHIFNEIENNDWSLLIAHVLGIDHCGHKHGMQHSEMQRKLNETNILIQEIIEKINEKNEKIMFFVIGDHGMTKSGDHGGDSQDEIEAAMFIYSKIPFIETEKEFGIEKKETVNQIDIVPTLAAILGIPVPFSNIGSLIVDVLPTKDQRTDFTNSNFEFILHSVWQNVLQAHRYISSYSLDNFLSNEEELKELKNLYTELSSKVKVVKSNEDLKSFVDTANDYFKILRKICYEVWVQFDSQLMSKGLVIFFTSLLFLFLIVNGLLGKRLVTVIASSFLTCILIANLASLKLVLFLYWMRIINVFNNIAFFACGIVSVLCFGILIVQNWDIIATTWHKSSRAKQNMQNVFSRIILCTTVCGVFSNSYVVEEDKILSFLLITMLCFCFHSLKNKNATDHADRRGKHSLKGSKMALWGFNSTLVAFGLSLAVRSSNYFWRLREEQRETAEDQNFIMGKIGSLASKDVEMIFLGLAIFSFVFYVSIVKIWLRNCGNLTGSSASVILAQYSPVTIVVAISFYWILKLQQISKTHNALSQQANILALAVYILFCLAMVVIFLQPLSIYLLPKKTENINLYREENSVPKLYEKVKNIIYKKKVEDNDETPIVYGLGTVYSSTFILINVFLSLIFALLLGFVIAPSIILMNIICCGILVISAIERWNRARTFDDLIRVSTPTLLCWFLTAEYFFYATGHQPTFQTIHWDAAFIGVDSSIQSNIPRVILVGINTFGSYIILGMALPLLVIIPFTLRITFPNLAKGLRFENRDAIKRDEFALFENNEPFHTAVFVTAGKYILIHGIKTFACMLAATIHCRHLMVWKIFAPKLIFEGISFLVTIGSVSIALLMLLQMEKRIEKFITKLTKGR